MNKEEVKRLNPTFSVLRELYLKSGNECAFMGCNERMIQSDGTFIGEVCHIEAAMPSGPRFNPNLSSEDRRKYDNLLLMCPKHHKITDNVDKYPVHKLKQIKKDHEGKFERIIENIELSIKDRTINQTALYPKTLQKINDVLKWGNRPDELLLMIPEINYWINKLKDITAENRKVFSIMIERSREKFVPINEVQHVIKINDIDFTLHYEILSRYGFISTAYEEEEYNYSHVCDLNEWKSGWRFWEDLYHFTKRTTYLLEDILVDLNFEVLD